MCLLRIFTGQTLRSGMVRSLVEFLANSVAYGEMGAADKIFAQYETELEGGVFASHTALV